MIKNDIQNEAIIKLKNIFLNRFDINLDKMGEDIYDKSLLGSHYKLSPRALLYVFFDVEKEFNITIPQTRVLEGDFKTFNGILSIINSEIDKK